LISRSNFIFLFYANINVKCKVCDYQEHVNMIQYVSTRSKRVHHMTTYYEHKPPSIKLMQRRLMIRMNVCVPKELAHCSILFSDLECTLYTNWNVPIKIFRCSQMHFIVIQNTRNHSVLSICGGLVCTFAWSRHPKYAVLHHKSNQWYQQLYWKGLEWPIWSKSELVKICIQEGQLPWASSNLRIVALGGSPRA
jgi:hypothetical protein